MASAVPFQNALLLTGYGWGKQAWSNDNDDGTEQNNNRKLMGIFIGGLGGGMLQSFVTSPVEWIKVQQQLGSTTSATVLATAPGTAATTTTAAGAGTTTTTSTNALLRNLAGHPWRGLHATLWRDGIPHGVWFCSYEMCKDAMEGQQRFDKVTTSLVSGAVAATVAWVSTVCSLC
jgi:solute carrier family 25 carnitine/acylcarnitine transporter 20/29